METRRGRGGSFRSRGRGLLNRAPRNRDHIRAGVLLFSGTHVLLVKQRFHEPWPGDSPHTVGNTWSLPKGGFKASDVTMDNCAHRELYEETGLLLEKSPEDFIMVNGELEYKTILVNGETRTLASPSRIRYETIISYNNNVDKYFVFLVAPEFMQKTLAPRDTGEIEDVCWIPVDELEKYKLNGVTRYVIGEFCKSHHIKATLPHNRASSSPL